MKNLKESKIEQSRRLKVTEETLFKRIDESAFGQKTKEFARRAVKYESLGSIGWGMFNVPPIIDRADGPYLYDADGKEYLDLLSGLCCSALGNNNKKVTGIIQKQAEKLTHYFDFPHIERIKLAEKLCKNSKISGETKVVFGVTGSDSVELAIRAARYYTGEPYILTAYGDYHGATYGTMGLTSIGNMQPYFYPVLPDKAIGYFHFPHNYRNSQDEFPGFGMESIKAFEGRLDRKKSLYTDGLFSANNVAAILVEPFQSSAGYYIPPVEYLQELRRIADKHGILLIVDEIQAGLGRSGKLWAFEYSGIEPDMICTAKALGGGLPLSAVIAKAEILSEWAPGTHISTQAGNVLACAAGNYVFDVVSSQDFLDQVNEVGSYFHDGLKNLQSKHNIIGYIDNLGMYTGIELVKNRKTKEPAAEATTFVRDMAVAEGMLLDKGGYYYNRIKCIPALNVDKSFINSVIDKFDMIFGEAEKKYGI